MSSEDPPLPLGAALTLQTVATVATVAAVAAVAGCRAKSTEAEPGGAAPPDDTTDGPIELEVNGASHSLSVDGGRPLLDVLRNELGLTGTKYGCGENQCGACTVLLDDRPVRSCTRAVRTCAGHRVTTVEGLADGEQLHPVQDAFVVEQAMQCGYCTSGMVMAAVGLLRGNPSPSDDEIREAMKHNLCRCGTYPRILRAVRRAATPPEDEAG